MNDNDNETDNWHVLENKDLTDIFYFNKGHGLVPL